MGGVKVDMYACDTFLCTYYPKKRPQGVNIDCRTVWWPLPICPFEKCGLGEGQGRGSLHNYSIRCTNNCVRKWVGRQGGLASGTRYRAIIFVDQFSEN